MATEVIGSHRYELTPAADFVKYWALEGQKETIFELQSNKTDDYFYGGNNNPGVYTCITEIWWRQMNWRHLTKKGT